MCNESDSGIFTHLLVKSVHLKIDSNTVEDLVYALNMGAGTSTLIGILSQGGVISSPPGWAAAAIGVVLGMIGQTLAKIDEGCGISLTINQYSWKLSPEYSVSPQ